MEVNRQVILRQQVHFSRVKFMRLMQGLNSSLAIIVLVYRQNVGLTLNHRPETDFAVYCTRSNRRF
jgi:hypothetical protein